MSKKKPTTDWHKQRAIDLVNAKWPNQRPLTIGAYLSMPPVQAFADYIAQHEDPPVVDPDLLKVREIVAQAYEDRGWIGSAHLVRSGNDDLNVAIRAVLLAIKTIKQS